MKADRDININPQKSKINFEEYLKKYPKDYGTYPYYASCCITLGKFNEAYKILNYLEKEYKNDTKFLKLKDRVKHVEYGILYNKLRLLSFTHKYKEMYDLCLKNYDKIESLDLVSILFYCQTKNNVLNKKREDLNNYSFKQMIEYSEQDFKEHIKKHLADYNSILDNPNKLIFSPYFPLENVLKEIKKYIPSNKATYPGFYEKRYIFKYDECGRESNKIVDYFVVVAFEETNNLLTMYPLSKCENLPFIDLNYMRKKEDEPKVKIPSQIEKFNRRFNKK